MASKKIEMRTGIFTKNIKYILKDWRLYVLLLPIVIWFALWTYKPMGGLLVAFKRYEAGIGVSASDFVGFQNFLSIIFGGAKTDFWQAFRNTFTISVYGLIFGFPVPIILALLFSEIGNEPFRKVTQTITYLPHFLSEVTITGIVIILVSKSEISTGIVAAFLQNFGMGLTTRILETPSYFQPLYIITGLWKESGYNSIVYFAAIMGISPVMYEAVKVDGGNKFQEIRYVTIPGMAPTLIIMVIMRIGRMLSVGYERVLLLYSPNIYITADVLSTFEQRYAFQRGLTDIGTAAGMFNSVIGFALVIGANTISRQVSKTSLW